jgi:hypothetical protein
MDGCEVRLCDPCVRVPLCARVSRGVNVNTTDATTGAPALLLPAQNTHTSHDPIRDTEHARAEGLCVPCVSRLPPVSFYRYRVCPGSPRCLFTGIVVRFVCVVRVPLCVRVSRVSRVCPGSPRCLFTGTPPGVFLPVPVSIYPYIGT